ncbi:EAL domain-containing protein [Cohnella candidum]|uniref:EAL domain-containing protein n=1 Tax=Cohnella candidum TaxID=2674991 RepID=A0A3G3JST3_9BACL|nr:EAL domain-containing protein [Cohnella candidum]AYQ71286.1 EAL domain-containing protein [Cohnella candidum]
MLEPYHFASTAPLRDEGVIEFATEDLDTYPRLHDTIRDFADAAGRSGTLDGVSFRYDNYRQLLQLLNRLQKGLLREETDNIRFRLKYGDDGLPWNPLSTLFETVGGRGVSEYILHRYFTTFLQPIVQPNGQIVGYECLLRPLPEQAPFRPSELFEKARKIGQHSFLDREARHAAIRMSSAHLPAGVKRFVNFLPSSLYSMESCLKGTFDAIRETGTDPADVVFEVAETERLDHPEIMNIFDHYRVQGIRLAVDDIVSGYSTAEMIDRLKPDYVKLDRKWVNGCHQDPDKQRHIENLLERASRFHGVVLAEGVEREQEWDWLRRAGVPLLQGYLFGLAAPVPASGLRSLSKI